MRNPTLERARWALTHPVSIAAIVALLINDHLLRWRWPSWWTGKIGDVAWLIFAPFALALLLSWLAPRSLRQRPKHIGGFAIVSTGVIFALVKTLPAAHAIFQRVYNGLLPWDSMLRRDPADLLTLPALLIAAWVWTRPRLRRQERSRPRRAGIMISLAMLATIANSAAPDPGITCLDVQDGRIEAYNIYSYYEIFVSRDGGLTWQVTDVETTPPDLNGCESHPPTAWILETPDAHYRFVRGKRIARSTDGGQTWQVEIELESNQARMAYYRKKRASVSTKTTYPADAIWDPESRHVIAAMGHEGVLVRTPQEGWRWIAVGSYRLEPPTHLDQIATLLLSELWLGLLLIALMFNTWCARGTSRWLIPVLIIGWVLWLLTALWKPALKSGYDGFITVFLDIGTGLLVAPLSIFHIVQLFRGKRIIQWWNVVLMIAAGLLFIIPYVGWALDLLPRYNIAIIVALAIALIFTATSVYFCIRRSPEIKRPAG